MTHDLLIVDDSVVMRKMLIRSLEMSGLSIDIVHEAGDGLEALRILASHEVDLVLVDINMPGMSGDELIDRIRADARTAALPIVVVSTERSSTRVESFARRGAGYVAKPFTPEQLRGVVLSALGAPDA
jgi:two-component system chemotaxis response regulator CheY